MRSMNPCRHRRHFGSFAAISVPLTGHPCSCVFSNSESRPTRHTGSPYKCNPATARKHGEWGPRWAVHWARPRRHWPHVFWSILTGSQVGQCRAICHAPRQMSLLGCHGAKALAPKLYQVLCARTSLNPIESH